MFLTQETIKAGAIYETFTYVRFRAVLIPKKGNRKEKIVLVRISNSQMFELSNFNNIHLYEVKNEENKNSRNPLFTT
jgi:hypothetical protein